MDDITSRQGQGRRDAKDKLSPGEGHHKAVPQWCRAKLRAQLEGSFSDRFQEDQGYQVLPDVTRCYQLSN